MKFERVVEECATATGDVQGIQGGMGIARRGLDGSMKHISSVKNKKKKKKNEVSGK